MPDGTVTLRDGRRLSYAEYGDPNGRPAFFFHGFPNSRLGPRFGAEDAKRRGIRLISLDRPGFGRSDFQPGRQIDDWPDDVVQVADALNIRRFAIIGVSGGGPYTAACAAKIPDRLTAVGFISALGPLTEKKALSGFDRFTRFMIWLSRRIPLIIAINIWFIALAMRFYPKLAIRLVSPALPKADRKIIARPEVRQQTIDDMRESFRQGIRGAVHEMKIYLRPWRFRTQDIAIQVHLWHGDADKTVPVSMAHYYAGAVPRAKLTVYPGEGHLMAVDRIHEINNTLFGYAAPR